MKANDIVTVKRILDLYEDTHQTKLTDIRLYEIGLMIEDNWVEWELVKLFDKHNEHIDQEFNKFWAKKLTQQTKHKEE